MRLNNGKTVHELRHPLFQSEMTLRARNDSSALEANSSGNKFNEEMHTSILAFIKKLGYRQTEQIFKDEARNAGIETIAFELRAEQDSSLQPAILLEKMSENNQKLAEIETGDSSKNGDSVYEIMFAKLKKWTYNSLDIYRDELNQILYPMFVHCFLDLVAKNISGSGKFYKFISLFYV
jgi:transcription initiation factor TFIID subunit 5